MRAVPRPRAASRRFGLYLTRSARLSPPLLCPVKKTVQNLLAEYGTVAVIVYFTIFFATLGGFWLAIQYWWQRLRVDARVGALSVVWIARTLHRSRDVLT